MIVCVVGLPGSGKTTLVKRLVARLGAQSLHPGKHAWVAGLVETAFPSREDLLKAEPQLSQSFLEACYRACAHSGTVVLDGFPHSIEQARLLCERNWPLIVLHLVFPSAQEAELSVSRQAERARLDGVSVEPEHLKAQYLLAKVNDAPAVEELRRHGTKVINLDALLSQDEVEAAALRSLGVA